MTPVEMVQEWMTAIGETEYDAEHRERLLWEELRELQAAMDDYHAVHDAVRRVDEPLWSGGMKEHNVLIAIARELCDVAYVAIGTALLRPNRFGNIAWPSGFEPVDQQRFDMEAGLYLLFRHPSLLRPILRAADYYGFGDKLETCFAEVHRANMRKLECDWCCGRGDTKCAGCHGTGRRVSRAPDDCILKPAGWQPPDLGKILFGEMGDKTNG